jgi:hypothetical protein
VKTVAFVLSIPLSRDNGIENRPLDEHATIMVSKIKQR